MGRQKDSYSWNGVGGYSTSLFDSSAINTNCTAATNSVFLKNVQTNAGSDGQRYYRSSQLGSPSASPDAQVFEPFQYGGKTYAWLFLSEQASSSGKDRVKKASDIARALGGYLYTLSDEQEVQAVHDWLGSFARPTQTGKRVMICEASEGETFCHQYSDLDERQPGIGLIRQEDGTTLGLWRTPSLNGQKTILLRGWYFSSEGSCSLTPSADDLQYEPKAVVAMIQPRNAAPFQTSNGEIDLTKVSSGYMDYYMSQDELWAVPKSFIIELPGNQSLSEMQTKVDEHLKSASTGAFVNNAMPYLA